MSRSVYLETAHKSTFADVRWSKSRGGFVAKVVTESRKVDRAKFPRFPILAEIGVAGEPITSIRGLAAALRKTLGDRPLSAEAVDQLRSIRPAKESANG